LYSASYNKVNLLVIRLRGVNDVLLAGLKKVLYGVCDKQLQYTINIVNHAHLTDHWCRFVEAYYRHPFRQVPRFRVAERRDMSIWRSSTQCRVRNELRLLARSTHIRQVKTVDKYLH